MSRVSHNTEYTTVVLGLLLEHCGKTKIIMLESITITYLLYLVIY